MKNGDHPDDYSGSIIGLVNGQPTVIEGWYRRENGWEGSVVRYFRRPDIRGTSRCKACGYRFHDHGWIDGGETVCPGRRSLATHPIELKVLLDMDGVLCDFIGGYFQRNSHIPKPDPWPAGIWDLRTAMPGVEFSMELPKSFWSDLDWMHDGQLILSTLTEEVGEDNICILSSCDVPNVGAACAGKMEWIHKHTPQFKKRYLFGPDKRFCAHTGAVLVDDKDENVNNFRADGGHAILVPRLWNSSYHRTNVPIDAYIRAQLDMIRDTTQLDSR